MKNAISQIIDTLQISSQSIRFVFDQSKHVSLLRYLFQFIISFYLTSPKVNFKLSIILAHTKKTKLQFSVHSVTAMSFITLSCVLLQSANKYLFYVAYYGSHVSELLCAFFGIVPYFLSKCSKSS